MSHSSKIPPKVTPNPTLLQALRASALLQKSPESDSMIISEIDGCTTQRGSERRPSPGPREHRPLKRCMTKRSTSFELGSRGELLHGESRDKIRVFPALAAKLA
jgi:hypothetical protein